MYSVEMNHGTTLRLEISNGVLKIGSTRRAGAVVRGAFALAVAFALVLGARPAAAQSEHVYSFAGGGGDAQFPGNGLTVYKGNFYGTSAYGGNVDGNGTVYEISSNGETVLYSFGNYDPDGVNPYSAVTFDGSGNLYGTTNSGGANNQGIVFELSPAGESWKETILYSFCSLAGCTDGGGPVAGVVMDTAGNLYGENSAGVFELSPAVGSWTEQLIYSAEAYGGLAIDASGNLYGVTSKTVFELSPNGSGGWNPDVLYSFPFGFPKDLRSPAGPPALDSTGDVIGITGQGGAHNAGGIYRLTPKTNEHGEKKWVERAIYSFKGQYSLGCNVYSCLQGVIFDSAGNMYLNTPGGFGTEEFGSVLKIAPAANGKSYGLTDLWNFNGTDGAFPAGTPVVDGAGNIWGVTSEGGPSFDWDSCNWPDNCGYGVVYELVGVQ